jgi:hypothetical protein
VVTGTAPTLPIFQPASKRENKDGSPDHLRTPGLLILPKNQLTASTSLIEQVRQVQQNLCLERQQCSTSRGDLLAIEFGILQ